MRHSDNIIHSWNFKPYDNRTISLPPMSKHSQWAFRLAQIPYHPKLFRQRPLRHTTPCLLWTNRLYHLFPLFSWPDARNRIRLGDERPYHRWGRLAEMARSRWWRRRLRRRWYIRRMKKSKMPTHYYICAHLGFLILQIKARLSSKCRPCNLFLFYLFIASWWYW